MKKYIRILVVAIIAILILTVTNTLITTKTKVKMYSENSWVETPKWDVGFVSGIKTAKVNQTSSNSVVCGSATVTFSTATINNVTFMKPNSSCTWNLTIKNAGTIDSYLSNIVNITPENVDCKSTTSKMICDNITYELLDAQYRPLLNNTELKKSSKLNIYLRATFKHTGLDVEKKQNNPGFTLIFREK